MKQYTYSWTKQYSVSAQIAGEIIQKLPQRTAEALLEQAANPASPLHASFEWNNTRAAQQFRLVQARCMINSLRVEVISGDRKPQKVAAFVAKSDRGGHYLPTLEADENELSAAELRCWQQMKAFRERWKSLQFAREVVEMIAAVERRVARRKRKAA